tara:strand:+ start:111 stop:1544 length:1434 start_codon:yes stop_codon:yes gene_type:complete
MNKYLLLLSLVLMFYSCKNSKHNKHISKVIETNIQTKPNIIVIVTDDAGYVDFGFMGSVDLQTPEIDKLAESGVIFTDAHVSATVCAPSRAGLLTGQYQQRFGFEANGTGFGNSGDLGLDDNIETLAEVLKKNNYKTIAIGKWHLGGSISDHPNNRGFDEFYGFIGGGRSYFPIKNPSKKLMLQKNGSKVNFEGYLTDALGNFSVNSVEQNKDNPFFMYLAYNAVHTPMEAKEEHLEKFKDHPRQTLAAMTWSLDENIGKLRHKLDELNILDNTLIYFISDNGGAHNNSSNMGPLKGWKGNKFEGGHRVPFVISWTGKIPKNQKFDGLTSSLDIFSTSLAAAKIDNTTNISLDGVSLLPYLINKKQGNPHDKLFWRKLEEAGVRVDNHKLIRLKYFGYTMYDLDQDLGETQNLSKSNTLKLNKLIEELEQWETEMSEPLWFEEKGWMDVTYNIHKQLMQNKKVTQKEPKGKLYSNAD